MGKIKLQGKMRHQIRSVLAISGISIAVIWRRLWRRPLCSDWSIDFEIGILFVRHQFNRAFRFPDIREGRAYFDSLIPSTGEEFNVRSSLSGPNEPAGEWHVAQGLAKAPATQVSILYLHGGGYTFNSEVSRNFARGLADLLCAKVFMPDYRLTPEHSHPAQLEDALTAYQYMLAQDVRPEDLVIIGDSAGGHLVLMLLLALKNATLKQPALAIPLCPWTDIGNRGASLNTNNHYDLVQGYMALQFGEWLRHGTDLAEAELSPMHQDYRGVAPIYMQGGGREILIDMIRDFASMLQDRKIEAVLDVWPTMTHNFQAHGTTIPESKEAFERMRQVIAAKIGADAPIPICPRSETPHPDRSN